MNKIIKKSFPYLSAIILWYMTSHIFNPFGILSIIPVFYYSFVKPIKYFFPVGLIITILLDYNMNVIFLFSSVYLIAKGLNEIYGILNTDNNDGLNIKEFTMFFGSIIFCFMIYLPFSDYEFWFNFIGLIWLYLYVLLVSIPLLNLLKRVSYDR